MPRDRRRPSLLVAALIAAVLGWGPARASPRATATAELRAAARHWAELDYELCIAAADRALVAPGARAAERIQALRFKGASLVVLDRSEDAAAVFEALLELDPDHQLPEDTSPRITAVFQPARARWLVRKERELAIERGADLAALRVTFGIPMRATGGRPLVVHVALVDPGALADRIVVAYRKQGSRHYSTLSAPARGRPVELTIPGAFTASPAAYRLQLHVTVRHRLGVVLRRSGTAGGPLAIEMAAGEVPGPTPLTRRWWFWTGMAAVAGGAIAIPLLVIRSRDVGPQTIITESPR